MIYQVGIEEDSVFGKAYICEVGLSLKFVVIGGGLVGLATSLKLSAQFRDAHISVLEKEPRLAAHQSGHNSGVLHCGLYYKPGSLKARLAVNGIREMTAFCQLHQIPHEICGKIVLATSATEVLRLRDLQDRGAANGLAGLRWIEKNQIADYEPFALGEAALHVPQEGIVDYPAVANKMADLLRTAGHDVVTGAEVTGIVQKNKTQIVRSRGGDFEANFVINCAGLHCDRVYRLTGEEPACKIVPFRGDYVKLKPAALRLVRHLIYPVPDPAFPFLGVHFTRMIGGGVEAGPSAVIALKREGYTKTDFSLRDAWESLTFPGLYRFVGKHRSATVDEIRTAVSRSVFLSKLQRLVPAIKMDDFEPGGAGVRAQAMDRQGNLLNDFLFAEKPGQLHVLNAPSPGATACLAIGQYISQKVRSRLAPVS